MGVGRVSSDSVAGRQRSRFLPVSESDMEEQLCLPGGKTPLGSKNLQSQVEQPIARTDAGKCGHATEPSGV